jgi:hypothetical protein
MEGDFNTLLFVSAESANLDVSHRHGNVFTGIALPGVYSCTLRDYADGDSDERYEAGGYCEEPQRVADGWNTDYHKNHAMNGLLMMNLQFHTSSEDEQGTNEVDDYYFNNDDGNSYLYGAGLFKHHEHNELFSWEILRAKLPTDRRKLGAYDDDYVEYFSPPSNSTGTFHPDEGGQLQFEVYFKTIQAFDWNNCDFDCCPFNDNVDSNGHQANRDRHESEYLHAFVRTVPRDYAIDKDTGDIFIVWEGFYKNCNPVDIFSANKMLEWTIGISRLKTYDEDPTCVLVREENDEPVSFEDLENNFARCTEPVTIVYQGTHGKDAELAYGGFTVIPPAKESPSPGVKPRRAFLLSAQSIEKGSLHSHLWAIPEGADVTKNLYKRQELHSIPIHGPFKEYALWNGGNIKVHYNRETSRPDHLCRSIFDQGIACMPITVTEDVDSVYVSVTGEDEWFLDDLQVEHFCSPSPEAKKHYTESSKHRMKAVSGLDVVWDENGKPQRIYFGCWGHEKNGRLGSVDSQGINRREMLYGAYPGEVILVPRELDWNIADTPLGAVSRTAATSTSHSGTNTSSYGVAIVGILVIVGVALYGVYKKRLPRSIFPRTRTEHHNFERRPAGGPPPTYMELPVISSSSAAHFS